jgi:hypothetical protein
MSSWSGWELGRVVLLLTAAAYVVIWAQLSLYHWAGAFKHPAMWGPVLGTPFVAAAALLGALVRDGIWGWIALALLVVGILEGLAGLYLHLQGVRSQIGGVTVRNVLSGPPPLLPVAYSAIGVFGVVALVWNA